MTEFLAVERDIMSMAISSSDKMDIVFFTLCSFSLRKTVMLKKDFQDTKK